jgi:Uma2 family endonuclease
METGTAGERGYSVSDYFALVEEGLIAPDERVELLEGLIVAMPLHTPLHASGIRSVDRALRRVLGPDVLVSCQLSLVLGHSSVPEPDMAVLPGRLEDYLHQHPTTALLVVEVSCSTLAQDRLTKSRIYAGGGIPEYWIVNLRDRVVEWHADPDPVARVYRRSGKAEGAERLPLGAFPEVVVTAGDLLPGE